MKIYQNIYETIIRKEAKHHISGGKQNNVNIMKSIYIENIKAERKIISFKAASLISRRRNIYHLRKLNICK